MACGPIFDTHCQVGKTTVLKQHLGDQFDYVSMENPRDYLLAKEDAAQFYESLPWEGSFSASRVGVAIRISAS